MASTLDRLRAVVSTANFAFVSKDGSESAKALLTMKNVRPVTSKKLRMNILLSTNYYFHN
jgi:hypothetical protein